MLVGKKVGQFEVNSCVLTQTSLTVYNAVRYQQNYHLYVYQTKYYQDHLDVIIRRAAMQTFLQHPHILRAFQFFLFDQANYFVIVCQPFVQTLKKRLWDGVKIAERCKIMGELAGAVSQVHKHNILHRQISLQSIYLDYRGRSKLAGFNLKDINQDTKSNYFNLQYAPQISTGLQSCKSDIWALGWVFLQIVEGTSELVLEAINDPEFEFLSSRIKKIQNAKIRTMLMQMLEKRPEKRCDIGRVEEFLRDINNQAPPAPIPEFFLQTAAPIKNLKIQQVLKEVMSLNAQFPTLKNTRKLEFSQPWYYQFNQKSQGECFRVSDGSKVDVQVLLQSDGVKRVWANLSFYFLGRLDLTNLIDLNISGFLTRSYSA